MRDHLTAEHCFYFWRLPTTSAAVELVLGITRRICQRSERSEIPPYLRFGFGRGSDHEFVDISIMAAVVGPMIDDGLIIADLPGGSCLNPFAFLHVVSLGTDGRGDPRLQLEITMLSNNATLVITKFAS